MKLTDEQIAELAPEWATHYRIANCDNSILFESAGFFAYYYTDEKRLGGTHRQLSIGINKNSKPIPRKTEPFDITQHEWSDEAMDCGINFHAPAWVMPDIEINIKDVNGGDNTAVLLREHAVALAKHFGLTVEDLK